jgi:NDP-sugar pyrophosphorylase family protein
MARALLLAAGKATRLADLRDQYAKACVPIGNTTPIGFLLPRLHAAGVEEVWINLHWKANQVRAVARAAAPSGLALHFLDEPELLGTGGTLLQMQTQCNGVADVVLNAKIFTDFDFAQILQAPPGSVVLHPPSDLKTFGGLHYDDQRQVSGLLRAADADPPARVATRVSTQLHPTQTPAAAVYTGISRPDPVWLEYLSAAVQAQTPYPLCLLRHGLLPALADDHQVHALLHPGHWCEISTPERVELARQALTCYREMG